jgi:ketosteroid isomerase-like protein
MLTANQEREGGLNRLSVVLPSRFFRRRGTMDTSPTGAQLQPDAAARIRSMIAPWVKACLDRDWDSLLALCTEDFVISGPEVEGQEVTETFDFTDVFRKDLDGTFRYSTVTFNTKDAPA